MIYRYVISYYIHIIFYMFTLILKVAKFLKVTKLPTTDSKVSVGSNGRPKGRARGLIVNSPRSFADLEKMFPQVLVTTPRASLSHLRNLKKNIWSLGDIFADFHRREVGSPDKKTRKKVTWEHWEVE